LDVAGRSRSALLDDVRKQRRGQRRDHRRPRLGRSVLEVQLDRGTGGGGPCQAGCSQAPDIISDDAVAALMKKLAAL